MDLPERCALESLSPVCDQWASNHPKGYFLDALWRVQIRARESWEWRKDEYDHFQQSRAVLSSFVLFQRVMKIQKTVARNYSLVLTAGAQRHSRHSI